jgi:hypothetical protein
MGYWLIPMLKKGAVCAANNVLFGRKEKRKIKKGMKKCQDYK